MSKSVGDIDIDVADRNRVLSLIQHHPAAIKRGEDFVKHASGIHVTAIPVDPFTGYASIDHREAEQRGYVKLDILNMSVYQLVRDPQHLRDLMSKTPSWTRLRDPAFCQDLIHIGRHHDTMMSMPEPVDSLINMAMFLAVIRPAKRHLIGLPWAEVAKTVWTKPSDESYAFRKSHAVAYAHLVAVHMNLLEEQHA